MARVYGRSDTHKIVTRTVDGREHKHEFTKKNREPAPGFGDDSRSVAVLDCNDPECIDFAKKHLGFSPYADRVELTSDEVDWQERASREGSIHAQTMAHQFGETLAKLASEAAAAKTR